MADVKWMEIREFWESGYLQELNRLFLHPLGLMLAVRVNGETNEITFAGVQDHRDDPEGIVFADNGINMDKLMFVREEMVKRAPARIAKLGARVQMPKEDTALKTDEPNAAQEEIKT